LLVREANVTRESTRYFVYTLPNSLSLTEINVIVTFPAFFSLSFTFTVNPLLGISSLSLTVISQLDSVTSSSQSFPSTSTVISSFVIGVVPIVPERTISSNVTPLAPLAGFTMN
jgi:hypothetical protein